MRCLNIDSDAVYVNSPAVSADCKQKTIPRQHGSCQHMIRTFRHLRQQDRQMWYPQGT